MQRKHVNMIRSHGHECHFVRGVIRGHSTVASNQSSPPGMQRAVGYKMHCSFVSPIPFNYAVQKGRRIVSERSGERNENTSVSSGVTDTSAISQRCNPGALYGGATYRSRLPGMQRAGTSDGIKGVCLHFSTFLSMTQCRNDVDSCVNAV